MPSGHIDRDKPLRPLTDHAWGVLEDLAHGALLRYEVNPGVIDRLCREALAEEVHGPCGRRLCITAAGRAKLAKGAR